MNVGKVKDDLQIQLNRLISFFPHWTKQTLCWSRVLIVEDDDVERANGLRIRRSALKTPEEYAPYYDALLDAGYPWINMNAFGIVNGALLIVIERPRYTISAPRSKASVNFSGPSTQTGWDLTDWVRIVD
jgi:hypothetical protein